MGDFHNKRKQKKKKEEEEEKKEGGGVWGRTHQSTKHCSQLVL